jgi:hypothetical protein
MPVRDRPGRKVLIASIGVATLNYVAVSCGGNTSLGSSFDSGGSTDTGTLLDTGIDQFQVVGNFAPPPPPSDATADAIDDFAVDNLLASPPDAIDEFPVANLVVPPMDSGKEGG